MATIRVGGFLNYLIIFVIIITVLSNAVEGYGHRQKFGESCSRNKKCDFTKWLRCESSKCVCFQSKNKDGKPELYYDPVAERCVGTSGTDCSQKFFPFDDEDANQFHMRGSTTNHWRYGNGSLRCGANAFCEFVGPTHLCSCRKNYYATDEGRCMKLKAYGDPCSTDRECDPDGFLKCDKEESKTCVCADSAQERRIYDTVLNKCTVLADSDCETRINRLSKEVLDDCTTDSFCDKTLKRQRCRCKRGTQIHSDRTCQRGYGRECDPDHQCGDSKLICRSKICHCKWPMHMVYDETSDQCVGLASGPCAFNNTSELLVQCVENAECVKRGEFFSECRCRPGFLQSPAGKCVKVFGSECEVDADCDHVAPLACVNSHCACSDLLLQYEHKTRKCKGLVGSRCKANEDSCIENATCVIFDQVAGGQHGKCFCNRNYRETLNRTCASY